MDKPEADKVYALTGKTGDKCIANGNTWAESEVKEYKKEIKAIKIELNITNENKFSNFFTTKCDRKTSCRDQSKHNFSNILA